MEIPTKKITVGPNTEYKLELTIKQWITQTEEDEYIDILFHGATINEKGDVKTAEVPIERERVLRDWLIEHIVTEGVTKEGYECLHPTVRKGIFNVLHAIASPSVQQETLDKKKA